MKPRIMLNGEGVSAAWMATNLAKPDMVAWYGTGTGDVPWNVSERNLFPGVSKVIIDQGGTGSPLSMADVRDVENGAWNVSRAVNKVGWDAPRPTIYCSQSTLPTLKLAGWTGDVWLAIPGYSAPVAPGIAPMRCVAVQNVFKPLYESSLVFDPTWPNTPSKGTSMLTLEVLPNDAIGAPFHPGAFTHLALYSPQASGTSPVGAGITRHSVAHGDTYHNESIHTNSPLVIEMDNPDVDAVWVHNMSANASIFISVY
jgi:hypothetical protein